MTTATATPPTDLGSHLLRLVGEPFLFARRSYGDELVLHFGERHFGPVRRTKHGEFRYEHGTYSLHLRGSAWVLKSGAVPGAVSGGLPAEIEKELGRPIETDPAIAAGARVTGVIPFAVERPAVKGFGLRVELSDGTTVVVIPTPDEPDADDLPALADWELDTPHGTLAAGPGSAWQFTPTDTPR